MSSDSVDVTISIQKVKGFLTTKEWVCSLLGIAMIGAIAGIAVVHNDIDAKISVAHELRTRCTTPECLDAAIWLVGNIDDNIDPCQHFYDHACFNYSKRYPLSVAANRETSILSVMKEANEMRLHEIVQVPYKPGQWGALDRTAERTNAYYTACIDLYQRAAQAEGEKNPVIPKISSQLGQSWWVIDQSNVNNFDWQFALRATAKDQNFVIFKMRPTLSPGQKSKHYLEFLHDESPSFGWAVNHGTFGDRLAFESIVREIGKLLVRDHGEEPKNFTSKIETFVSDVVYVIRTVLEPSHHVAENYRNNDANRKIYDWADYKIQVGSDLDLDAYVNAYTGLSLTSAEKVVEHVNTRTFFYTRDALADLMKFKKAYGDALFNRAMNNYFTFRIVFYWMSHLSYEYNHLYRQYYTMAYDTVEFPPDWEHCMGLMALDLPKALSALYVSKYYDSETEGTINRMTEMINHTLYREVDTLDWMDTKTRESVKRKLRAVQFKVGKPSTWTSDTEIAKEMERHYGGVTLKHHDHYGNVEKLIPVRISEDVRKLKDGADGYNPVDEWRTELYDTRVEYYALWNEILIPAGIIQQPMVHPRYPSYMNFGGIGTWIASALISVIDEDGQAIDEFHDNQNPLWTTGTWDKYNVLKNTVIEYYNTTTPFAVQLKVDIPAYAPFAIRETGGIRQAFISYQRYLDRHGLRESETPLLSHSDINQNFFYAYAGGHCDSWSSEATLANTALLRFMPTFMHVDGGVSQFYNQFQSAFKCEGEDLRMVPPQSQIAYIF